MKRKLIEGIEGEGNEATGNAGVPLNTGDEGLDRLIRNGTIQNIQICCGVPGPHQHHKALYITLQNGTKITSLSGLGEKSMSIEVNGETYKKQEVLSVTNPNFSFLTGMNNNPGQQPKTYRLSKFSANDNTQTSVTSDEFDAVFNQLPEEVKSVLVERINSNTIGRRTIIIDFSQSFNNNGDHPNPDGCRIS